MQIDELRLQGFGRFQERTLHLAPGLNVIHGPNEAGKSTLVDFLVAMLYGLARPGLRRRVMLPEHERYRPWDGDGYRGMAVLTLHGGRRVRVERDFARHRVRVLDAVTGQPLDLPAGARGEPAVGETLLGLSRTEFTSTVCIGQLQTAPLDAEAAAALAARMAALQATGRQDESAARALEWLEAREREIGSERARRSPLGSALAELEGIQAGVARIRATRTQNLEREARLCALQTELRALEAEEARLSAALAAARLHEVRVRLDRIQDLVEVAEARATEVDRLRAELAPLAPLATVDPDEAERVPAYFEAYEAARARAEEAEALIRRQEAEVAQLEEELRRLGLPLDAAGRVAIEAEISDHLAAVKRLRARIVAGESVRGAHPGPGRLSLWVLAALMALGAAALTWRVSAAWGLGLLLVAGALAWQAFRTLLQRYGCDTATALRERLLRAASLQAQLDAARSTLADLRGRPGVSGPGGLVASPGDPGAPPGIPPRLLGPLRAAAGCSPDIARALAAGAPDQEAIEAFTRLWRKYRDGTRRLQEAERAAGELWDRLETEAADLRGAGDGWAAAAAEACASRSPARIREAVEVARRALGCGEPESPDGAPPPDPPDLANLEARRSDLSSRIRNLTAEVSELQGVIRQTYEDLPDLAELERQQAELSERVEALALHRRALARAKEILEAVAAAMQRDFAPRLAGRVEPIVRAITEDRYRIVRLDERLNLATEVPETGELRPVTQLSAGALDQFYLALRLGAALELTAGGEAPPLILDDPLIQYDDARAAAALRYLRELAGEHQVLLFTCHRREVAIARGLGARIIELELPG